MALQAVRFVALLLVAMGLSLGAAHALEMSVKMRDGADMYTAVLSTIYGYYMVNSALPA